VHVHNLVVEQTLVSRSTEFEAAMQNGDKSSLRALCDKKSQESLYVLVILAQQPLALA
jgi:protein transport protein SEC31